MPTDTTPEAEAVQIELLRQASPARRFAITCSLSDTVINLARRAIVEIHPEWSPEKRVLFFVEVHYGRHLADRVRQYLDKKQPCWTACSAKWGKRRLTNENR